MYAHHERKRWSVLQICGLPTCRPEVARPVNTRAFLVTYLVRLSTTGLLDRNKLRSARDTDMMDDSRKKDRMYLQ